MGQRLVALSMAASLALISCTGSDGSDVDNEAPPAIGAINGPAVVDPSFDPFATEPSATDGG